MGEVLLARNLGLDRLEAIKIIVWTNQKPSVAMRFQREAQVSGQLKHPAIVPVYSMRSTDECIYYTMPYIPGPSLHQAIGWAASSEDAPALWRLLVSPDSAGVESSESASNLAPFQGGDMYVFRMLCERFAELADGLHTAHGMGVVHRDIKPANILVAPNGTLRLMDFGLAFVRDEVSLTHTGQVLGTPQFMSPEQIMSHVMRIDHRSDVYSLGASMYAAFTLRPPFDIEEHDIPGLLRRITTMMPPRPGGQRSRFPVDLEGILLHCLEKDSSNRYSTAKDLALDLRRFLHFEPIQARNVRLRTRFSLFFKRHQQTVRATSVAAALLFVGLAFLNLFSWVRSGEDMAYARRLIVEAESFTDEGVAMYRWSRAHADAGKNVEARMWAEEGDHEMDQAIARSARVTPVRPPASGMVKAPMHAVAASVGVTR
jgi:serine/threonine protein kinase